MTTTVGRQKVGFSWDNTLSGGVLHFFNNPEDVEIHGMPLDGCGQVQPSGYANGSVIPEGVLRAVVQYNPETPSGSCSNFSGIKKYNCISPQAFGLVALPAIENNWHLLLTISPQVVRELEEDGILDVVRDATQIAYSVFSTLRKMEISIKHDPEIADRKTVQFTLVVSGNPEKILEDEAEFNHLLRSIVDSTIRQLLTIIYEWEP